MIHEKRLLVTGATGFLGKRLVTKLLDKYEIYCLVRKNSIDKLDFGLNPIIGDITDLNIENNNYDIILHMAATTKFNESCEENLIGTKNIMDFALKNNIKRVYHVSTAFVCGDYKGKFSENDLDKAQGFNNHYEKSKFECEKLIQEKYIDKLDITIFRPSIIYEKGNIKDGIGFNHILWALNKGLFWKFPGKASNKIYLVDIKKVMDKIITSMNSDSIGKTINIVDYTLLGELVTYYSKLFNVKEPEFIEVNEFKKNKTLEKLFPLLPYIDTKVEFE